MSQVDQALQTIGYWFRALLGVLLTVFAAVEQFLRGLLVQLGVPGNLQSVVILVVAVLFIPAALRIFGGLLRILLIVFLILLILHVLLPGSGI